LRLEHRLKLVGGDAAVITRSSIKLPFPMDHLIILMPLTGVRVISDAMKARVEFTYPFIRCKMMIILSLPFIISLGNVIGAHNDVLERKNVIISTSN
jgi:hypothetical protein